MSVWLRYELTFSLFFSPRSISLGAHPQTSPSGGDHGPQGDDGNTDGEDEQQPPLGACAPDPGDEDPDDGPWWPRCISPEPLCYIPPPVCWAEQPCVNGNPGVMCNCLKCFCEALNVSPDSILNTRERKEFPSDETGSSSSDSETQTTNNHSDPTDGGEGDRASSPGLCIESMLLTPETDSHRQSPTGEGGDQEPDPGCNQENNQSEPHTPEKQPTEPMQSSNAGTTPEDHRPTTSPQNGPRESAPMEQSPYSNQKQSPDPGCTGTGPKSGDESPPSHSAQGATGLELSNESCLSPPRTDQQVPQPPTSTPLSVTAVEASLATEVIIISSEDESTEKRPPQNEAEGIFKTPLSQEPSSSQGRPTGQEQDPLLSASSQSTFISPGSVSGSLLGQRYRRHRSRRAGRTPRGRRSSSSESDVASSVAGVTGRVEHLDADGETSVTGGSGHRHHHPGGKRRRRHRGGAPWKSPSAPPPPSTANLSLLRVSEPTQQQPSPPQFQVPQTVEPFTGGGGSSQTITIGGLRLSLTVATTTFSHHFGGGQEIRLFLDPGTTPPWQSSGSTTEAPFTSPLQTGPPALPFPSMQQAPPQSAPPVSNVPQVGTHPGETQAHDDEGEDHDAVHSKQQLQDPGGSPEPERPQEGPPVVEGHPPGTPESQHSPSCVGTQMEHPGQPEPQVGPDHQVSSPGGTPDHGAPSVGDEIPDGPLGGTGEPVEPCGHASPGGEGPPGLEDQPSVHQPVGSPQDAEDDSHEEKDPQKDEEGQQEGSSDESGNGREPGEIELQCEQVLLTLTGSTAAGSVSGSESSGEEGSRGSATPPLSGTEEPTTEQPHDNDHNHSSSSEEQDDDPDYQPPQQKRSVQLTNQDDSSGNESHVSGPSMQRPSLQSQPGPSGHGARPRSSLQLIRPRFTPLPKGAIPKKSQSLHSYVLKVLGDLTGNQCKPWKNGVIVCSPKLCTAKRYCGALCFPGIVASRPVQLPTPPNQADAGDEFSVTVYCQTKTQSRALLKALEEHKQKHPQHQQATFTLTRFKDGLPITQNEESSDSDSD